jgi:hypothetical protein
MPPGAEAGWLLLSLGAFALAQRTFHRQIQNVLILAFRRSGPAVAAYFLFLLPGIFLHEVSHGLAAVLVGVPVRGFSVWPRLPRSGMLHLGQVTTARTDVVRSALIGVAPIVVGSVFLAFAAARLGFNSQPIASTGAVEWADGLVRNLTDARTEPGWAVWLYLALAVANTLLPSVEDRASWWAAGGLMAAALAALILAGVGPFLVQSMAWTLRGLARGLAGIFLVAALLDVAVIAVLAPLRFVLEWASETPR